MLPQNDFNHGILDETSHRPWPLPDAPWIMTQTWHDLLFAHWPVDSAILRAKIPAGLTLDLFGGEAWLGVIPFHMTNVTPRGVPALPWISAFPELNVRTYVSHGDKPGIFFFSLDAGNALAVGTARTLFHLPYFSADMTVAHQEDGVAYRSRRLNATPPADLICRYRPTAPAHAPVPGTLEHFLTERYCLYTTDSASRLRRLQIHHPPWPLQPAAWDVQVNTMAEAAGIPLPATPPLLHFSRRQDMVAYPMESVG